MKPLFNINDPNLKEHQFKRNLGVQEEIKSRILEQTIRAGKDNSISNQVVWAAAAGIVVFVTLFGALSQLDYSFSLYNTTPLAEKQAQNYIEQELDELSMQELSELADNENHITSTSLLTDDEITAYLTYADISNYELEKSLYEN